MDKLGELLRAGLYLEALKELKENARLRGELGTHDTLLAEILERIGDSNPAVRLAERTLSLVGISPALKARCHTVVANVLRDRGQTDEAIQRFRSAIAIARDIKDGEHLCWAELRLFLALADGPGPDAAIGFLPTLRRDVWRLGDPLVSAALHLFLAQIETKRGLLRSAREHVRIGRSLLTIEANSWLEGTAAIAASCLAFLDSDLESSTSEAMRALREAERQGHLRIRRAALANIGHLQLAQGSFITAERSLLAALALSQGGSEYHAGITDGLAQIALSRKRYTHAKRLLRTGRRWTIHSPKGLWYYGLWRCLTQGRVLLREGSYAQAVSVLNRAAHAAASQSDPSLSTSLRLLYAEALVKVGEHDPARAILGDVMGASDGAPIEALADIARVAAQAVAARGEQSGGFLFERAARIFATIGNRTARSELMEDYAGALAARLGTDRLPSPAAAPVDALPAPPRRVTMRLDTLTRLEPAAIGETACMASRAAAVIESGAYPEILGREVMALLRETACVPRAVLSAKRADAPPEVLQWWGCSWTDAVQLAGAAPRRLELGRWQGGEVDVALSPPAEIGPLTTLLAVEKLARSARWQEKARREERERAALWPIEPGAEATEAIFVNGEMNAVVAAARKVAPLPVTVLLTGETGTGKEVLARVIHAASPRADRPFVPFNCTAVPRDMIDSQLFGYRRGAFTGAVADFPGVIRAAAGGTLFLDEIGEVALDVQPKLLRFLESGEIQPLGDPRPRRVGDVRVVASTNANLEQLVSEGRFRSDLFYRLNVVRLRIPPLRERREEIPPLAEHFLQRCAREFKKGALRLAEETMEYLVLYRWPGNVRELANEMRRLAVMAEAGAVLMPEHLEPSIAATRRTIPASERQLAPTELVVRLDQPLPAAVEHLERTIVRHALDACGNRLEDAARVLGLSRKGLYLKRQRLGLDRP